MEEDEGTRVQTKKKAMCRPNYYFCDTAERDIMIYVIKPKQLLRWVQTLL